MLTCDNLEIHGLLACGYISNKGLVGKVKGGVMATFVSMYCIYILLTSLEEG